MFKTAQLTLVLLALLIPRLSLADNTQYIPPQYVRTNDNFPILALSASERQSLQPNLQTNLAKARAQNICVRMGFSGIVKFDPPTEIQTDAYDIGTKPTDPNVRVKADAHNLAFSGITCLVSKGPHAPAARR